MQRLAERAPELVAASALEGVRGADLPFYESHVLVELRFAGGGGPERVFGLHGADATRWLDGSSGPIHDTNAAESLELTDDTVHDYVRLFLYFVRGDSSPFVLIEAPDELATSSENPDLAAVRSQVTPITTRGTDEA